MVNKTIFSERKKRPSRLFYWTPSQSVKTFSTTKWRTAGGMRPGRRLATSVIEKNGIATLHDGDSSTPWTARTTGRGTSTPTVQRLGPITATRGNPGGPFAAWHVANATRQDAALTAETGAAITGDHGGMVRYP